MALDTSLTRAAALLEIEPADTIAVRDRLREKLRELDDLLAQPGPPPRRRANEKERRELQPLLPAVELFAEVAALARAKDASTAELAVRRHRMIAAVDALPAGNDRDVLEQEVSALTSRAHVPPGNDLSRCESSEPAPLLSQPAQPPPPVAAAIPHGGILRIRSLLASRPAELRLCAEPEFRLGRSRSHVDFAACFLPATTENNALTGQVSSIHARLHRTPADLLLLDGSENKPSTHGTFFDGARVTAPLSILGALGDGAMHPLRLPPYELSIRWHRERRADGVTGALLFLPMPESRPLAWSAVWLFTSVGLTLRGGGVLPACTPPDQGELVIKTHEGRLWLETRPHAGEVRLDGRRATPGQSLALRTEHQLGWGGSTYLLAHRAGRPDA